MSKANSNSTASKPAFFEKIKAKLGSRNAYIITTVVIVALMLALAIIIQAILGQLDAKHNLRLDVTKQQIFTISDETSEFVKSIEKDIKITVLSSEVTFEATFPQQLAILQNYAKLNDRITLGYEDVNYNPQFLNNYPNLSMEYGDVLVECGDVSYAVSYNDLYFVKADSNTNVEYEYSDVENAMNYALVYVMNDRTYVIGFTTGHGETESSQSSEFIGLIENNFFEARSINLSANPNLADIDILIARGPESDFTDGELKVLDTYLTNNGSYGRTFCYLAAVEKSATPLLDQFLSEWGLVLNSENIVYEWDSVSYASTPLATYAAIAPGAGNYGKYYANLNAVDDYKLLMPYSHNIGFTYAAAPMGSIDTQSLLVVNGAPALTTVDKAVAATFTADNEDPSDTSYTVLALSTKTVGTSFSRVLLSGSSLFVSDPMITTKTLINAKYIVEILKSWVDRPVSDIYIDPTNITAETFTFNTYAETIIVFALLVVLPPLAILIIGVTVYSRRKHL